MLIRLTDDFIQDIIVRRVRWLKEHPLAISHIFYGAKRETVDRLRDFLVNKPVRVIIGYPKDQSSLPAYVITIAGEQEVPFGLGDDIGTFSPSISDNPTELQQIAEETLAFNIAGVRFKSSYKIECWSDNGDLAHFMYVILKWALLSAKMEMDSLGWTEISQAGTDLEPVPDYFPIFVYRRALILNVATVAYFHSTTGAVEAYYDILSNLENYHIDESGNVVDADGNIVIPRHLRVFLQANYEENEKVVATWQSAAGDITI